MAPLCDVCREREATVFVTKIVENAATKQRLCEPCARDRALGEGWIQHLTGEDAAQLAGMPLDEIVLKLFGQMNDETTENEIAGLSLSELEALDSLQAFGSGEFPSDEDLTDELDEMDDENDMAEDDDEAHESTLSSNPFALSRIGREIPVVRCPKCETTWDRLRQDGRVGCANCYEVFGDQLGEVMDRLQNASQHTGKAPRTATKRRRRLEHLRARRDHRLAMLQGRLQEAIAAENYEEAAKLRDKIKIVASTIVSSE